MLKIVLAHILFLSLLTLPNLDAPVNTSLDLPVGVSNINSDNSVIQPQKCTNSADLVFQALVLPDLGVYCTADCQEGYCCVIAPKAK